jgi:predicted alpha/beta-hydrolase family hydrolase
MDVRLDVPERPHAALVLAHGAGAGMDHAFMRAAAEGLAQRGVAVMRYEFPFMAQGLKRPDSPAIAHAAVREAVALANARWPGLPLFAGGKSFGARMTSQAQAAAPLDRVQGLVFLGFPLHPAKQPAVDRAKHLDAVALPMIFLQGTRDALAEMPLVEQVVSRLGSRATLVVLEGADHAFHVLKRSGTDDASTLGRALDAIARWMPLGR